MDKIQQIISLNKSGFNAEQIKNIFKALDENGQLNKEEVMQALGIARSTATRTMHRASFLLPNVHTMKEKNHLYVYKERK